MDAIAATSADPVAAASSAAPAAGGPPPPLDWHLAALLQPALVHVGSGGSGGWLPLTPRLWLEWAMQAARAALEMTLDRPVSVSLAGPDPGSPREAVFAIAFDHPGAASGGGTISLDLPAARAIVDTLETDFANVRGAGAITDAESGVLEYATLATVDHALRSGPASAQKFIIRTFHDARAVRAALEERPLPSVALRVRIAGREGIVRLHLNGFTNDTVAAPPPPQSPRVKLDPATPITVRMAFPPLRIARGDVQSLQAGDVLMIGATDLQQSLGAGCRLVTAQGWSLSAASIVRDSPTVLTARCGAFALDTLAVAPPGADQSILNVLVGSQEMTLEQVRQWRADATIDLPKDPALPVDVVEGLERIGRGELVRLDGEIGARIVNLARPAAKGAAAAPATKRS
jgi:hypothetical protein